MPALEIVKAVTSISSFLGLLALLAYLYFLSQTRSVERSVRAVVGGDRPYLSQQVVQILETFRDDSARLEALKTVTSYETADAKILLEKVKNNVDVAQLTKLSSRHYLQMSRRTTLLFIILTVAGLGYYNLAPSKPKPPAASNPSTSADPGAVESSAPEPKVLFTYTIVTKAGVVCHNGRIEKRSSEGWVELIPSDTKCEPLPVGYEDLGEDDSWFYAWDNARNITARFPKTSGQVNWLPGKVFPNEAASKQWNVSQTVTRVN